MIIDLQSMTQCIIGLIQSKYQVTRAAGELWPNGKASMLYQEVFKLGQGIQD